MKEFKNETYLDFTNKEISGKQKEAIAKAKEQFGKEYPNIINGEEVYTEKKTISKNPANTDEVIGKFQKSGQEDAEKAIQAANEAFKSWQKVPAIQRAEYLFKAAEEIRKRRYEINAWMILESGKNFLEADADLAEAIDFLEHYGREAIKKAQLQPVTSIFISLSVQVSVSRHGTSRLLL